MNNLSDEQSNDTFTGDDIKTGLSFISKINKGIGKYGKNNEVGLSSSILSYLSALTGIANSKSSSGLDITSDMLSLFKSSVKVEDGIYKYYEKTLHPYEVSKLDAKFGKAMTGLGIASNVAGTVDSFIDTYKAFVDPESSAYDKAAETIKAGGSIFELGGSVYVASQATGKSLQFVSSAKVRVLPIVSRPLRAKFMPTEPASPISNSPSAVTSPYCLTPPEIEDTATFPKARIVFALDMFFEAAADVVYFNFCSV